MRSILCLAIVILCAANFAHGAELNPPFESSATGPGNITVGVGAGSLLTTGYNNIAIGDASLLNVLNGHDNTAVGVGTSGAINYEWETSAFGAYALHSNKTTENTAVGAYAGYTNTSGEITAVGYRAGYHNTTGIVTGVGRGAGEGNSTGTATAVGYFAGTSNSTGNITAVGFDAASNSFTGNVTAVGYSAATNATVSIDAFGHRAATANTTGFGNVALGGDSLLQNTTGSGNLAAGATAGEYLLTGSYNTILNSSAPNISGSATNNIIIGHYSDAPSSGANNTLDIGNAIYATGLSTTAGGVGTPFVGIANQAPAYPLDVTGDMNSSTALRIAGTSICTSAGCTAVSDERLKKNILPLENSLNQILQLQGVSYSWKDTAKYGDKEQIGLIAQELEKVFPEVVVTDAKTGLKSVAYDHLIAPMIEAVKSLNAKITDLAEASVDSAKTIEAIKNENAQLRQENSEIKLRLAKIEKALETK